MKIILDAPEQAPVPYKIFSPQATFWGTFLGGPVALGYMVTHNYKAFGENHKVAPSWGIIIAGYMALVLLPELLPVFKLGSFATSLLLSFGGQYAVGNLQKDGVSGHLSRGGDYQPWQTTLLVGFIGLIATSVIMFIGLLLFMPEFRQELAELMGQ